MTRPEPQPKKALAYGLGAVLLWSTVATAFKLSLRVTDVLTLLGGAACFSTVILGLLLGFQGRLGATFRHLRHDWQRALGRGLLNPISYYLALFEAYDRLPAQVAQPINYSWAITLSLLGALILDQPLTRRGSFSVLLGYVGVAIVSLAGLRLTGGLDPWGLLLAFLSSLLWALYWLLQTKDPREPLGALFQNFLVCLPVLGIFVALRREPLVIPPPEVWLAMAYVGAFEMGFTFALFQLALLHSPHVASTSSLAFLTPFLSLVVIHFILGEPLHPLTFVGLVLIVAALLLGRTPPGAT